jgi:Xaa-Pro aminopeptidase
VKVRNDDRLAREMQKAGIDIVLAFSMENVFYLSGAMFGIMDYIRDRLACAGFTGDRTDFLLCATNEMNSIEHQAHVERRVGYVEFERTPIQALAELLNELGYSDARIGVEKRYLMAQFYEDLAEALPKAALVGCDDVIETARAVKLPAHIDIIEKASRSTERAALRGFSGAVEGETEKELALRITNAMYREGADTIRHLIVTVGDNRRMAHPFPSVTTRLNRGDMIRIDIGGLFNGYGTDLARMAVVGRASDEQTAIYKTVRGCTHEVGHAMRAGMTAGDVYEACRLYYEKAGIAGYKRDHVGHSLSILGAHDQPMLHAGNSAVLEENMVIALEPILRDEAGRRVTVEDVFVIGKGGSRKLSAETDMTEIFEIV